MGPLATAWQTFAEGEIGVTNGVLGTFDPTGLPNGAYQLQLRVTDWIDGTTLETDPVTVQVGELSGAGEGIKVGQFTVAFNDLSIPVSGLPITLTRTYDSRRIGGRDAAPSGSDFGAGWELAVSSVRLQKSGVLGEGWVASQSLTADCIFNGLGHVVTITFPDNTAYRFTPRLDLNRLGANCTAPGGLTVADAAMVFDPVMPGSGTLVALHAPQDLRINTALGLDEITLHEDRGEITTRFDVIYDPAEFLFTTLDGRQFLFNAAGKVVKMTDRNGNSLTFGDDGIIHSSGKSVRFVRDTAGRITRIYDPNGLDANGDPNGPAAVLYEYDALNLAKVRRLTDRSLPTYLTTEFLYTNASYPHYLTAIKDPRGMTGIRNEYDDDGKLKSHTDADGKTITYVHDINGRKETIVDRLGHTSIFSYDTKGNVTMTVNALGETNLCTYDSNGNKLSETNPKGETIAYTYGANNLLLSISNAVSTVSFGYNEFGQPTNSVDALGRVSKSEYNAFGNLTKLVDALTNATHFLYDTNGNLVSQKDAGNNIVTNRYDAFGRLTNTVELSTLLTNSYAYDANGNRTNQITSRTLLGGGIEKTTNTFIYDGQDRLVHAIEPDGKTNSVVYNEIGKQKEVIDKLGRKTQFDYDERGYLKRTIYPDNTPPEESAYDAEGRRTFSTNRLNYVTEYVYDSLGRLTQSIFPDKTTNITIYDSAGRVAHTVDARGTTNAFGYDDAGRRTSVTNAWGIPSLQQVTTYAYDAAGNLTNMVDAASRTTDCEYDDLNRAVKTIFPATVSGGARPFTLTGYDSLGRRVAETNEAGVITRYGYDGAGRVIGVTNAWNTADVTRATYAYDQHGNQTNQTDALGRKTRYDYDNLGRRIKRVLPGGQFETFGYDTAGNLLAHTNFNGLVITNQYDLMSRLMKKAAGTNVLETYAYDALGRLTNRTDPGGAWRFVYDERDRLKTNAGPVGSLYYKYDVTGNLVNLASSTANGTTNEYQYDRLNRVTNVVDQRLTATRNTAYQYDAVGNLATLKYPNGITNLWQYDARHRLTNVFWKLNTTTNASFAYRLGVEGNRTNLIANLNGWRTNAWGYDQLYRLTSEVMGGTAPTGTISYKYDIVGNRTNRSSTVAGITNHTLAYNTNDWLTMDSYDNNGNTTSSAGVGYQYNYANRLTNANSGGVIIIYNAAGDRISKKVGTTNTLYLVDDRNLTGYAQVLEELTVISGVTNLARAYTYGLDLISQRQPSVSTNFFGHDGLGSTRFLADSEGGLLNRFTYDAYGTLIESNGVPQSAYLFGGEQWDFDLGLCYERARYLKPNTGRFWTMDSYEGSQNDPLSLHKYLYAHGNPANMIDPSGHESLIGLSIGSTINASLSAIYNGVDVEVGNALQATLFGVQAGMGANEILTGFIFDETGIGLAVDVFNAVRGLFQDKESEEIAAYMLWEEQLIATILAAMEDDEFGEITVEIEPQCFVAGTPVATETGLRPIEEIKPGDKVWSWNEATDEVTLRPVVNRFVHQRSEVFEIKVGRDVLRVTGEHPFYVAGKGWTPAREVRSGDQFITGEDCALIVDAIERQDGDVHVYNFEVSIDHNYYVGEEGVLTHNANALRRAMRLNNPLLAAHHIVALGADGAAKARTLLLMPGTGIVNLNDIRNGVPLPKNLKVKPPRGFARATVHSIVHTRAYYAEVERRLQMVAPRQRIRVLQQIAGKLRIGKFPY